jgi:anti-sigma B factor antagonist
VPAEAKWCRAVPLMVEFSITGTENGGTINVAVAGELDMLTVGDLERVLTAAAANQGDIVVDLAAVSFADSTALTVLVKAHRDRASRGRRLVLARPSAAVDRLLGLTDLLGVLNIQPPVAASDSNAHGPT